MKIMNMMIVLVLPMVILMVGCGEKTHKDVMIDIYEKNGYEKASDYIDSLEDPIEKIDLIYSLGAKDAGITEYEFKALVNESENEENLCDKVEIVDDWITGDWATGREMTIVLKNNTGETLDYVKVDIFYYDKDGNLKDTEWTNKSGTFLDGGEFRLETYVDTPLSVTHYKVEVSEVKIK